MGWYRHGASVVAGLILVGMVAWLVGGLRSFVELPTLGHAAVWLVASCIAGLVARTVLVDLAAGSLAVAAAVALAISIGLRHELDARPLDMDNLYLVGVAAIGTFVGARLARPRANARPTWIVVAIGTAGLGMCLLVIWLGVALEIGRDATVAAMCVAGVVGTALPTRLVANARGVHGALGLALVFATMLHVARDAASVVGSALFAMVLGGIGARLGAWWRTRARKPDLPEVRQVS